MPSPKAYAASACGINIDPQNPSGFPATESVSGVEWIRIEFKDCTRATSATDPQFKTVLDNYNRTFSSYIDGGAKILLILTHQSFPEARTNNEGFAQRAALIANEFSGYGDNIAYEIWNEPDHPQGGNMTAQEYGLMLQKVVEAIPESSIVVSAGLAGEDSPGYIKDVAGVMGSSWSKIDGVGIHPYGKIPPGISGLGSGSGPLGEYMDLMFTAGGNKPLWITEIGYNTTEDLLQSQYLNAFYNYADTESKIKTVIWYAWHDSSVGSFGLTRTDGSPKSTFTAFFRNACDVEAPNTIRSNPTLPGISVEDGASCTPLTEGSEDRVISGFVRTTKMVRESIPCRDGGGGCTRSLSNQPITGATVTAYTGNAEFGTGFYDGQIENKVGTVITDQNGYFEIETRPGDEGAPLNFLFFRCGREGKDLWMIDITNNVHGMYFYLDCDTYYDTAYEGPDNLDVVAPNGVLSCKLPEENYYQTAYTYDHERAAELELQYANDDSQLGKDVDDVEAEINTDAVDTRIEGSNKVTFAEWYNAGWGNLATGGPNNKPAPLAINDDAEPDLAQCDFWRDCNAIVPDPEGSGGSMKQCGGLGTNTMLSGFSWEEMYAVADLSIPVCEDPAFDEPVKLGEITPPFEARKAVLDDFVPADSTPEEIAEALGYKLDHNYFPYGILFSPQNSDWVVTTKNEYLTQTDHYENIDDIREEECPEDGNQVCADRAFESGDHIIYPPGPIGSGLNRLMEICTTSNTSPICKYLNDVGYGGPVAMLFALPGAEHGIDADGNLDPQITYNPTDGGRHIQLGYPLTEYCGCNQNAGECEDPAITNFSNVNAPNGWVSDFVFERINSLTGNPDWQDTNTVRGADGASFFGRTIEKVANGIARIVSKFPLPGNLGGQCHEPTWGPTQATSCFNDPNGFECREVPCTEELGGVEATCYQSKNISQGYTCLGNTSVLATVVNEIQESGTERQNAKYLTTAFCLPGDTSCNRPNTATLINYDATHVGGGEPGFGANVVPNEGAANTDFIRTAFSDPPVANKQAPPDNLEEDRGGSSGTIPISGSAGCGVDPDLPDLADFFPDGFPQPVHDDIANYDNVNNTIKTQVVDDGTGLTLAEVYAEASKELAKRGLNVPCEALAGLHHLETGGKFSYNGIFNASLLSGVPITQPEANISCPGCTFDSVLESAVLAGEWLYTQGSMRNTVVTDHKTLAEAFAKYYGWDNNNLNCGVSGFTKHALYSGTCEPDYPGEDSVYAMNWVDERHRKMYEGASGGVLKRAGAIAVAVMFYMSN